MIKTRKSLDGNLFASMRIVLPEHREKMREVKSDMEKQRISTK